MSGQLMAKTIHKLAQGDIVRDRWWPEWGNGIVTTATKKKVRVLFSSGCKAYDQDHFEFLNLERTAEEQAKHLALNVKRLGRKP